MSVPSFHHAASDDESEPASSSITNTEFDCLYPLQQTSHVQPVHAAYHTPSSAGDPSSTLLDDILPWNDFPTGTLIQTPTVTARLDPFPSLPLSTFPGVPITLDASNSHSSYGQPASSGIDSLFSQREPRTVTMPTVIGHLRYNGRLIRAHDELSCGLNDDHSANYPREILSSSIAMPMAMGPAFGVKISNFTDPIFRSGPPLPLYSGRPTSTFLNPLPFNPAPSITQREGFDTESYLSLSPSFYSPSSPLPETSPKQIYPERNMTASSDQLTIMVPSEAVEFPSSFTEKIPFFRCHWEDCDTWITSEDRAIRDHMIRAHSVQKREDGSYRCEWASCSSSGEWSGLVRHIQKHLRLRWLCSLCEKSFARRDCVRGHANRVSGCKAAHPISYHSKLAYTARINGDGTVTLTKVLQPKNLAI